MSGLCVSHAGRRVDGAALDVLLGKPEKWEIDLALPLQKPALPRR